MGRVIGLGEQGGEDCSFNRIFRSAAFETFLKTLSGGRRRRRRMIITLQREEDGGVGIIAACARISVGVFILPYTGAFVPRHDASDRSEASRNAACASYPPLSKIADRDIFFEWCRYDGNTGLKMEEHGCFIRGWATNHDPKGRDTPTASQMNHRCLMPNCEYSTVELYAGFPKSGGAPPWIVYSSSPSSATKRSKASRPVFGRKISESGELLPALLMTLPPKIGPETGDIYRIAWPVLRTIRPVNRGHALNANYGDGYVAISPHLSYAVRHNNNNNHHHNNNKEKNDNNNINRMEAADNDDDAKFCECEDCLTLSDVKQRSIFVVHSSS